MPDLSFDDMACLTAAAKYSKRLVHVQAEASASLELYGWRECEAPCSEPSTDLSP